MKQGIAILLIALCSATYSACTSKPATETTDNETQATEQEHADENTTTLSPAQIKTIGIELGTIETKELTHAVKANGVLAVPNQNKAFVTPLFSGVVKSLHVQPGTMIKQGQLVATIINPQLMEMQQQLQQLHTQITLAETEVTRQKELVEGNAAPLKKLQQAEAELSTLKTQRDGIQKHLSGIGASPSFSSVISIKAPISGVISNVTAQLGSNVDVSTPIAEIINVDELHLDLFVYEKDMNTLKNNQTIHFIITNNAGREYDAEIFSIGAAFEPGTKTIPVHARVKGDKTGLIDGMNVTALISLNKSTVPAVPTEAIVTHQGTDYIFVVKEEDPEHEHAVDNSTHINHDHGTATSEKITFERVPVAKGTTDIGYSEITLLKTIPARAKVVTKGAFFILATMTNSEGHSH